MSSGMSYAAQGRAVLAAGFTVRPATVLKVRASLLGGLLLLIRP